ncbi:MAG: preprotein translocase subunit YajC [bacterium]|nr:preprotein translocase subunit YajC [bacterium]
MSLIYAMAPPAGGERGGAGITAILPLILIFVIFYFLLILPQRQQRKKHQEMLKGLNKGNKVVTSGGIHGTIVKIDEATVVLQVSQKTELVVDKSVIARVVS